MSTPILATKLYIPPLRPKVVLRPRLIEKLNEGLIQDHGFGRKLTLVSARPALGKPPWSASGYRPSSRA